jgi:hypothetical protein
MKCSRVLGVIGALTLGLALSHQGFANAKEKVYTWTDVKGVVHYGERPPKNVKATLVSTRTGHSDPTPEQVAAAQPKSNAAPATNRPEEQYLKDPERCAKARENLAVLNSVARIRTQNAEGVTVFLTEEEKATQRTTTQLIIDQACD